MTERAELQGPDRCFLACGANSYIVNNIIIHNTNTIMIQYVHYVSIYIYYIYKINLYTYIYIIYTVIISGTWYTTWQLEVLTVEQVDGVLLELIL